MGWFRLWAPSGALDSRNYGAVDCASSIVTPTADVEEITVPGRNGTVIIPQNRWNNVDREFSIYIKLSDWTGLVRKLQECSSGYYTLEDSWNSGHIYMARLRTVDLQQSTPGLTEGIVQIVFDCQPERWVQTGLAWKQATAPILTLWNSTLFPMRCALMLTPSAPPAGETHYDVGVSLHIYNAAGDLTASAELYGYWPVTQYSTGSFVVDSLTHTITLSTPSGTVNGFQFLCSGPGGEIDEDMAAAIRWPEIPAGGRLVATAVNATEGGTVTLYYQSREAEL